MSKSPSESRKWSWEQQKMRSLWKTVVHFLANCFSKKDLTFLRMFVIFGLTKTPFGDYLLFFLGFLSKSKKTMDGFCCWWPLKSTEGVETFLARNLNETSLHLAVAAHFILYIFLKRPLKAAPTFKRNLCPKSGHIPAGWGHQMLFFFAQFGSFWSTGCSTFEVWSKTPEWLCWRSSSALCCPDLYKDPASTANCCQKRSFWRCHQLVSRATEMMFEKLKNRWWYHVSKTHETTLQLIKWFNFKIYNCRSSKKNRTQFTLFPMLLGSKGTVNPNSMGSEPIWTNTLTMA